MTYLLPPTDRNIILESDPICKGTQNSANQTIGSPMLRAASGSQIILRYQENGHVTLPATTPQKQSPGTIFVYGTDQSAPSDSLLGIHRVWTTEGDGGDRRGRLLGQEPFDDGMCYQINGGAESKRRQALPQAPHDSSEGCDLWCGIIVTLPHGLTSGSTYALYWVWDWPTVASQALPQGRPETYTTCIDIAIL